ncbi:Hypothetical protein CINCED_3A004943 [Cinara cedri]|uniref:Uncharacterized protein n=1 Tax=Cinara cedri TaxID=506608 RepID=A0A5E4MJE8_9HEMI|nr:Hypothetical protein CINCED_3A004943 [Cinara cedri]
MTPSDVRRCPEKNPLAREHPPSRTCPGIIFYTVTSQYCNVLFTRPDVRVNAVPDDKSRGLRNSRTRIIMANFPSPSPPPIPRPIARDTTASINQRAGRSTFRRARACAGYTEPSYGGYDANGRLSRGDGTVITITIM